MVRYLGEGKEVILGVPMRDMTDEEWAAVPEDGRAIAEASGLFELVDEPVAAEPEPEQED